MRGGPGKVMLVGNQRRPTEIKAIRRACAASPRTGTNKPINSSKCIPLCERACLWGKEICETQAKKSSGETGG